MNSFLSLTALVFLVISFFLFGWHAHYVKKTWTIACREGGAKMQEYLRSSVNLIVATAFILASMYISGGVGVSKDSENIGLAIAFPFLIFGYLARAWRKK